MIHRTKDEALLVGEIGQKIREAVQLASKLYSEELPVGRYGAAAKLIDKLVTRALRDLDDDLRELDKQRFG